MSEDVAMQIWPTIYDGIAWSEVGEIAIATSEHVELLIPKVRLDQDHPDQLWEKLHLRTNAFDTAQVDVEEPIAWSSSSLGEEISASEVVGLDWSPQGLATHKRCALAVHTQNLALSIWAPTVQPRSLASWKRHVIINRELQRYFISLQPEQAPGPGKDKSERLKRLQRVRAFAWSPTATIERFTEEMPYAALDIRKEILMAVSNDNNEVIILRMPSTLRFPTSPTDASNEVSAVGHFSIFPEDLKLPDLSWTFEEHMQYQSSVSKLAWSPWYIVKNGTLMAIIVCATWTKLFFRRVLISTKSNGITVQLNGLGSDIHLATPWPSNGILRWLPSETREPNLKLVACTGGNVILCGINALAGSAEVLATYTREDWDPVAGCVITGPTLDGNSLFFASQSSTNSTSTVHLDPYSLKPLGDQNPSWKTHMVRRKEDFSKEHRLGDLSVVKLWGMAISTVKDLAATLTTVHPSQQPEYLIQSDYRTTLSVVPVDSQPNPAKFVTKILRENLSAETVAYSVKFWLKHSFDSVDKRKSTVQEILNELDQAILRIEQEPIANGEDSPTANLNTLLYQSKALKAHRMKRLISLFDLSLDPAASSALDMVIVAKLTTTILRLPRASWKRSVISNYIILEYKKAISKLQADLVHQAEDLDLTHTDMKEQCEICEAEIPLEDLKWARCVEGHEFARCALTFLAIQAPGISKYCGICGKQYIEGTYLETDLSQTQDSLHAAQSGKAAQMGDDVATVMPSTQDQDNGADKEGVQVRKLPTLAQLVFAACDTCIYCGGKFVG